MDIAKSEIIWFIQPPGFWVLWSANTIIMDYFVTTHNQKSFYSSLVLGSEEKTGLTA